MFTRKTFYTDSFGQKMERLPTVQQILAVLTNTGDEVHIQSRDNERGYYEDWELDFYITDEGAEMSASTDRADVLDVLSYPVVDVYGGKLKDVDHMREFFCWHIVFDTTDKED